jgi:HEAT repeat protein
MDVLMPRLYRLWYEFRDRCDVLLVRLWALTPSKISIDHLLPFLDHGVNFRARAEAVRCLARIGNAEVIARLSQITNQSIGHSPVGAALSVLASIGTPSALLHVTNALSKGDKVLRSYAVDALLHANHPERIVPLEKALMSDPDPSIRSRIIRGLGLMINTPEVTSVLVVAFRDCEDFASRQLAAQALSGVGWVPPLGLKADFAVLNSRWDDVLDLGGSALASVKSALLQAPAGFVRFGVEALQRIGDPAANVILAEFLRAIEQRLCIAQKALRTAEDRLERAMYTPQTAPRSLELMKGAAVIWEASIQSKEVEEWNALRRLVGSKSPAESVGSRRAEL